MASHPQINAPDSVDRRCMPVVYRVWQTLGVSMLLNQEEARCYYRNAN